MHYYRRMIGGLGLSLAASGLSACGGAGAARVEPVTMAVYPQPDTSQSGEDHGCSPVRKPREKRLIGPAPADYRPGAIDLSCFTFPDAPTGETAYVQAVRTEAARNRLAAILLKQADDVCTSEKALLLKRQAEVNGWLSIATTGLSTVSTIVTGELAKSILSGGAALTSGSRDHINTHVYRNQMIQTVTKAIDTERTRILDVITPRFDKDNAHYSVDAMIRDVNSYHQACSFGTGLQIVMESVDKRQAFEKMSQAQQIDDQIRMLQDQNKGMGLAPAAPDSRIDALTKERIRIVTGITLP